MWIRWGGGRGLCRTTSSPSLAETMRVFPPPCPTASVTPGETAQGRLQVHTKETQELSVRQDKNNFYKRVTNSGFEDTARRLRDAEQNRRREELQRRIEETRMKLQNVRRKYNSVVRSVHRTQTFTPPMKCFHPSFNIQAPQLFNFLPLVTNFRDTKTSS